MPQGDEYEYCGVNESVDLLKVQDSECNKENLKALRKELLELYSEFANSEGYAHIVCREKLILKLNKYEQINYIMNNQHSRNIPFEEISSEVVFVFNSCVKAYNNEKADFVTYFDYAFQRRIKAVIGKAYSNMMVGVSVPKRQAKMMSKVRALIKDAEDQGLNTKTDEFAQDVAEQLETTVNKAKELIRFCKMRKLADEQTDEEGKTIRLSDTVVAPEEPSELEKAEDKEQRAKILESCIASIKKDKERQLVVKLITLDVVKAYQECREDLVECKELISKGCLDEKIIREFIRTGKCPCKKDIADQFNVKTSSASRSLTNFRKKLMEKLKEENFNE